MTVPLMRRHGARMEGATALANRFLSGGDGHGDRVLAALHHHIDLPATRLRPPPGLRHSLGLLGAGVEPAQRAFPKMPDKIHAYTYVGL